MTELYYVPIKYVYILYVFVIMEFVWNNISNLSYESEV